MKNLNVLFIALFLFIFWSHSGNASHVAGSRITYEYLGPNQYLLKLTIYRDCSPGTATMPTSTTACYYSVALGVSGLTTLTIQNPGGTLITPSLCYPTSGPIPCYEEYNFAGPLTLPMPASDWNVIWQLCCRSNFGNNLMGPGGSTATAFVKINSLAAPVNSSPQFNLSAQFTFCLDSLSIYNLSCSDSDGDSLVYSLKEVQQAISGSVCSLGVSSVNYVSPYSGNYPFSSTISFTVLPSGEILFIPNLIQSGYFAAVVEEYRNGIKIGEIYMDHLVYIIPGIQINPYTANQIKGKVFFDFNQNQIFDTGDHPVPGVMIHDSPVNFFVNTSTNGDYTMLANSGTHIISIPNSPPYFSVTPAQHTIIFPGILQVDSLNDFALSPTGNVQDLTIQITGTTTIPPTGTRAFSLKYRNKGTQPASGSVVVNIPAGITLQNPVPAPSGSAGNLYSWNYSNLYPLQEQTVFFQIQFQNLSIGSWHQLTAEINPIAGDSVPADNMDTLSLRVVASCDPNAKYINPSGSITPQQVAQGIYLDYTVTFQNVGNAPAQDVLVIDTLDSKLNIGSFEFLGNSHPCIWSMSGHGILVVSFPNIMLPDSTTNEPESHGFFSYRIKPKNNLTAGQSIANFADIFFDTHAPITTNTVITPITNPLGLTAPAQIKNSEVEIYPNPFKDELWILCKSPYGAHLKIYSVTGRLMYSSAFNQEENRIELTGLASGMYFVKITLHDTEVVKKLIRH